MGKISDFIRHTFDEPDGSLSSSRILAASCVLGTLVWISYLVFLQHALPDLHGAAVFVGAGFSGYGVNKISAAIGGNNGK